ncbi:MAG: hypothetical protein U0L05_01445 [Schaedlerella sp.]|nr:hypothetical protein [Schaedlerella sp.]
MVILATREKELFPIRDANVRFDVNKNKDFSVMVARSNWDERFDYGRFIYINNTEYGGIIGSILTSTELDYVEIKGMTWRGRMTKKIILPPDNADYKTVSGELHEAMRELIEPEFGGLFKVVEKDTGVSVNFQFDRFCTLYDGIVKMLKSVGYKLKIFYQKVHGVDGNVYVEAVPIVDYSRKVRFSQDNKINFTMESKRDGVNHLIVTGKGELQDRNIFHLYLQKDGTYGVIPYYTGLDEIAEVYENTSTEESELQSQAEKRFKEVGNKQTFDMDIKQIRTNVEIEDIVGGRDYLTKMYAAEPISNIVYEIINGVETKTYSLEGDES